MSRISLILFNFQAIIRQTGTRQTCHCVQCKSKVAQDCLRELFCAFSCSVGIPSFTKCSTFDNIRDGFYQFQGVSPNGLCGDRFCPFPSSAAEDKTLAKTKLSLVEFDEAPFT